MRRLILSLAAAMAVAAPLTAASDAMAQSHDGGRRAYERQGRDYRDVENGRGRPGRWQDEGRGRRSAPPASRYDREDRYPSPFYAPQPPRTYGYRRGGYMPPDGRGAMLRDYQRYRLRPPPPGFSWFSNGDSFMLVGPDGRIFDVIR